MGQHHDAGREAVGFVRNAGYLIEVHDRSRNIADTGPWPWPNGYAAHRHSVTQPFANATASGTVFPCASAHAIAEASVSPAPWSSPVSTRSESNS